MFETKRILCPVDFSEPSKQGLSAAIELARLTGSELLLLHVVPAVAYGNPEPAYHYNIPEYERFLRKEGERLLADLAKSAVPTEVRARCLQRNGRPADEIVAAAADEGVSAIVMATHGQSGWRHFVFGSVAEKVVRTAPCAVLTVRGTPPPEPTKT